MSSVLITGVGGFVGGALAQRFSWDGHKVVGLMRSFNSGSWMDLLTLDSLGVVFETGDVTDRDLLYRILVDYDIDVVVHQAAQSIVKKSQQDPDSTYSSNIMGLWKLMEACRWRMYGWPWSLGLPSPANDKKPLKAIVVATTDKVYGNGLVPYVETQPLRAFGPYSASKVAADIIARDYFTTYGLPVRVVRSSNIYGPGDLEESRVVPGTIQRLLRGEPAVIYEQAWAMEREFVYIDDEVEAYRTIIEKGQDGEAYNVGGSGPVSIVALIQQIASHFGQIVAETIQTKPTATLEIDRQYMDASKLESLGWSQKVSLEDGLQRTIEWWKNRQKEEERA